MSDMPHRPATSWHWEVGTQPSARPVVLTSEYPSPWRCHSDVTKGLNSARITTYCNGPYPHFDGMIANVRGLVKPGQADFPS